ncbi:hypothetical protein [Thermococcus sp.]|uniref:hypothetical protein n=1 Tax=Thermococcus sp. TaxID=35749 RepID=UPI0026159C1C|nr:hypothetical protein [Thermococcus sp.]
MRSFFFKRGEGKEKKHCARQKRIAGALITLMLLVSVYAEPVAAWPGESLFHSIKQKVKDHTTAIIGVALIGVGLIASSTGIGATVGGYAILAGASMISIDYLGHKADQWFVGSSDQTTMTTQKNATESNAQNDDDNPDASKVTDDANQAGAKAVAELTAKLRSDFIQYGSSGYGGDLSVEIWGPSSIYGFSAFPTQIRLTASESPIPFNVVHLLTISVYVIDKNGNKYWTRTWSYNMNDAILAPGQSAVYTTILKGPDPLLYQIKNAVDTGQISRDLYDKIWNTSTSEFEIHVHVTAKREAWKGYPDATTESDCQAVNGKWYNGECYVFDKYIDILLDAESTSAWKHVTGSADVATITDGMYGTLPIKFLQTDAASKWVIYQSRYAGALSDFVVVTAASPVHVLNATANYKFIIAPNPGYLKPANPTITDDFRFVILRVLNGGEIELADQVTGMLGVLLTTKELPLTAHYTDAPGVLTYHALGLAYVRIVREDGTIIPVWLAAEPQISVEQNIMVAVADTEVQKLIASFKNNDRTTVEGTIQSLIQGLQQKIQDADDLLQKARGVGNKQAEEWAQAAIDEYNTAIDDLKKAGQADDYQQFLNMLNAAKKHEQAGDYYRNAARKALNGDYEQAKIDAQKGQEYSDLASEYEPHFNVSAAKAFLSRRLLGIPLWFWLVVIIGLIVLRKLL